LVSLLFFSFKVIFKLKVVWKNIVQNFEFITFLVVSRVRTPDLTYIYVLSLSIEISSQGQNLEFIMNKHTK